MYKEYEKKKIKGEKSNLVELVQIWKVWKVWKLSPLKSVKQQIKFYRFEIQIQRKRERIDSITWNDKNGQVAMF